MECTIALRSVNPLATQPGPDRSQNVMRISYGVLAVDMAATSNERKQMFKTILGTGIAMVLLGAQLPAWSADGSTEGFPAAQNPDYMHLPGADQQADGVATVSAAADYLFIAGSAFTPRASSQTVTYPGGGCTYSDLAVTTSLELPRGAVIEGVRLYYYSTSAATKVTLFLTSYPGDGSSSDLLVANSTSATGYSSEYFSAPSPVLVSPINSSYALSALMDTSTRLCGMRVFYGQ